MKSLIKPRCTVILCTCNGEEFLSAQLASLLTQTRLPDALVVGDDRSSDATLDILAEFRDRAPFSVTIHVGEEQRLGPAANFARTLEKASGDWFAFCDQDDIWHVDKLERLEAALMADAETILAFSDATLVASDLSPLGRTVWQGVGLDEKILKHLNKDGALPVLLKRYRVMGAAMAFSSELLPRVLPLPPGWPHDAWIATIAASTGRLTALPQSLLDYRQHGKNVVGALRPNWTRLLLEGLASDRRSYLATEIARHEHLLDRLESLASEEPANPRLQASRDFAAAKLAHLERRAALPDFPPARWPYVLTDWWSGEYRRWATDWRSLALDLFLPHHKSS